MFSWHPADATQFQQLTIAYKTLQFKVLILQLLQAAVSVFDHNDLSILSEM